MRFFREHGTHIGGVNLVEVPYVGEPKPDSAGNYDPEEVKRHEESLKYWTRAGNVRDDSPLGVNTVSRLYQDVADPICDFLYLEHQKFRNGEYKQSVPIFVCPRCGNLVMPKRIGRKKFCSNCSDKGRAEEHRKKMLPQAGADYQYLRRLLIDLEGTTPNFVRLRLRNPKVRKRLAEIKKRTASPSCQKFLGALEYGREHGFVGA